MLTGSSSVYVGGLLTSLCSLFFAPIDTLISSVSQKFNSIYKLDRNEDSVPGHSIFLEGISIFL